MLTVTTAALLTRGESTEHLIWLASVIAALTVIGTGYTKARKPLRRGLEVWRALSELLFGSDAEPENPITGAPAVPAIPGIGKQLADHIKQETQALEKVSDQVATMAETLAKVVENQAETQQLRSDVAALRLDHGRRLAALEQQREERLVSKVETVEMLRTIQAVADPATTSQDDAPTAAVAQSLTQNQE